MSRRSKPIKLSERSVLWSLGGMLFASLPGWAIFPLEIMLFSLSTLTWRLLAHRFQWAATAVWLKLPLVITALALLYFSYGHLYGRRVAAAMLLSMMSLKALEMDNRRDSRVLVSLGVFLAATYFLFLQYPIMLIYGLVVLMLMLHSLNILQLEKIPRTAVTDQDIRDDRASPKLPLFSGAASSLRVILYALPLGIVLFIVFPRLATPLWGVPEAALDGKSGPSDKMAPGSIQSLYLDDSPAFRVEFMGNRPARENLYWRGPVLWNFDGRSWTTLSRGLRRLAPTQLPERTSSSIQYQVQMEPSERHWMYTLDYPVDIPVASKLTQGYQLYTKQAITNSMIYRVTSEPEFQKPVNLSPVFRQITLNLPESYNPKSLQWVNSLASQIPANIAQDSPESKLILINKVLNYFNQEAFYYSLNPPLLGHHSVDEFLFNTRNGFCEHYASTFTVLMRMAGIPARVVTGYQGGYYNQAGEYLLLRQSDAHAWSEVWIEGKGWLRIDPTSMVAPERILSGALGVQGEPRNWHDFGWLRTLRNNVDLIQHFWNNWVQDYSAASQSRILQVLGLDRLNRSWLMLLILAPIILIIVVAARNLIKIQILQEKNPLLDIYKKYLRSLINAGYEIHLSDNATKIATKVTRKLNAVTNIDKQPAIKAIWEVASCANLLLYSKQEILLNDFETLVKDALSKIKQASN